MTAHPARRRYCPRCGRRIKITRNAKQWKEHTVDWRPGAPLCPTSGTRYVPPAPQTSERTA